MHVFKLQEMNLHKDWYFLHIQLELGESKRIHQELHVPAGLSTCTHKTSIPKCQNDGNLPSNPIPEPPPTSVSPPWSSHPPWPLACPVEYPSWNLPFGLIGADQSPPSSQTLPGTESLSIHHCHPAIPPNLNNPTKQSAFTQAPIGSNALWFLKGQVPDPLQHGRVRCLCPLCHGQRLQSTTDHLDASLRWRENCAPWLDFVVFHSRCWHVFQILNFGPVPSSTVERQKVTCTAYAPYFSLSLIVSHI